MVSVVLVGIWVALAVYNIYKWMFHKPPNFPPGNNYTDNYYTDLLLLTKFILLKKDLHACQYLVHIRIYCLSITNICTKPSIGCAAITKRTFWDSMQHTFQRLLRIRKQQLRNASITRHWMESQVNTEHYWKNEQFCARKKKCLATYCTSH